ncbi:hypothetical protein V2J09_020443 [Rumex salicifolius]
MESKITDQNKVHEVDDKNIISSPNERLRDSSSSSSSVQSSEFEDPSQGDGLIKEEKHDQDYKIPSHAFERNKSGNPGEWSINSNESLFSIKMGATSFTDRDQFNWIVKPEESNGDGSKKVDEHHHHTNNEDLHVSSGDQISSEPTVTEKPTDVASKSNVSTVNRNQESKTEIDLNSNAKSARNSDASGQSFAFPLLIVDQDRTNPQRKSEEQTESKTPQKIPSSRTDQVHVENRQATQCSSSWFTRCFSFCSCRRT